jgi:hypothetical protein
MPVKVISFFNNKGGVGKTTLACNIGHAACSDNGRVRKAYSPIMHVCGTCVEERWRKSIRRKTVDRNMI